MKNIGIVILFSFVFSAIACSNENSNKQQSAENKEIPVGAISINYNHHIRCKVMLRDSIQTQMIFDTGCTNLLFDSTFYADYLSQNGNLHKAMLGGAGDGYQTAYIDASGWDYRIGEKSASDKMATIVNLSKIVGDDIDGMFGMNFMQGKRVEINYADGYMRFLPADEEISKDFTRIQCKWINDQKRILVPLSITLSDGFTYNGYFLIDTGMTGTLSFNTTTATKLNEAQHLANARRMIYTVGGIGGSRIDYIVKSQQITVGDKAIKDMRITWSGNAEGALASNDYDGLIGNELLDRFDVIFDFIDCALYIRPNNKFYQPQPNDLGIALRPMTDHWIVNGLLESGNAEQAGLKRGDYIEAINGFKANDENFDKLLPLPEQLKLTVRRENNLIDIVVMKE